MRALRRQVGRPDGDDGTEALGGHRRPRGRGLHDHRTDARAVSGLTAALERLRRYREAGADVLFFEAPKGRSELETVAAEFPDTPLLANMTEGGETPLFTAWEFEEIGFDIVIYPVTAFKAAAKAMQDVFAETGTQRGVMDKLTTWEGRNELTGLADILELEERYATEG